MKGLRGKHHYKSYKAMCEALDIEPAPRGEEREAQKRKIQTQYEMKVQPNNSIDLIRIPKKEAERQKKLERGQIKIIDGREVDLGSNLLYADTYIDYLILYRAMKAEGRTNTKEGFVISCFDRTKLFRELLEREGNAIKKYSKESVGIVHKMTVDRLFSMVNNRLARFEKQEYIQIRRFYLLKNGQEADIEEVKPYVEKALQKMGLKTEYQAYSNKERREEFLDLRSSYYEEDHKVGIVCKRFIVRASMPSDISAFDDKDDVLGKAIDGLTNKDIQVILTSFFDIFREKAIFEFEKHIGLGFGRALTKKQKLSQFYKEHEDEVKEIINTYCAYMNHPLDDEPRAFYSIKELEDYYGETASFQTALDHTHGTDTEKFESGDVSPDYNEVDGIDKQQYNFYALSNMAGDSTDTYIDEILEPDFPDD